MPLSRVLDALESLGGLRRRGPLVLAGSAVLTVVLLLVLPTTPGIGPYRGPIAAAFAAVTVLVGIAAGPWIAAAVALLAGVVQLKYVIPVDQENSLVAGVITIALWVLAGTIAGISADQYRRRLYEREHSLARAVLSERSALERAERLLEAERAANELESGLDEVNQLLHSTLEFEQIMQQALREGMQHLQLDGGIVEIREDQGWTIRYQYGAEPLQVGVVLTATEAPVAARAVQTMDIVVIEDTAEDGEMDTGFWRLRGSPQRARRPAHRERRRRRAAWSSTASHPAQVHRHRARFRAQLLGVRLAGLRKRAALRGAALAGHGSAGALPPPHARSRPACASASCRAPPTSRPWSAATSSTSSSSTPNRVAVLIGDVSGKGIEAAGLTETVRSTVRAFALLDARPDVILHRTNEVLIRRGGHLHATAYLLVLDLERERRGMPAPGIRRRSCAADRRRSSSRPASAPRSARSPCLTRRPE